jgi:dTMP kinase
VSFIVLEGLDGAGTTTQLQRLADALRQEGFSVTATREPSDGPVGMLLRQALTGRLLLPASHEPLTPHTLALLFAADRMDHLASVVEPALARGEIVLSDRYLLSSLAYQGTYVPMSWVERINHAARPADLTLFLEVDSRVAAKRRQVRGAAEELFEADATQKRIAQGYKDALKRRSLVERVVRLNGEKPVEEVTREALRHIRALVGSKR